MADKDDDIGYKKPPKKNQFKPGQSGNPKGRPKGLKNLSTDLKEELEQKIVVTEGGRTLELTKQRAMLKTLMAKALKGDARSTSVLIQLTLGLEQLESGGQGQDMLPEDDLAILETFKKRLIETNTEKLNSEEKDNEND